MVSFVYIVYDILLCLAQIVQMILFINHNSLKFNVYIGVCSTSIAGIFMSGYIATNCLYLRTNSPLAIACLFSMMFRAFGIAWATASRQNKKYTRGRYSIPLIIGFAASIFGELVLYQN